MKVPNILDVKQATTLAVGALGAAIFIAVFGPVVAYALAAVALPAHAAGTVRGDGTIARMTPEQALRRSVMSCMLWEKEFYEDGEEIGAGRGAIAGLQVPSGEQEVAVTGEISSGARYLVLELAGKGEGSLGPSRFVASAAADSSSLGSLGRNQITAIMQSCSRAMALMLGIRSRPVSVTDLIGFAV